MYLHTSTISTLSVSFHIPSRSGKPPRGLAHIRPVCQRAGELSQMNKHARAAGKAIS